MPRKFYPDDECEYCRLRYGAFRTGYTFKTVRMLMWRGSSDPKTWRYKRRHTVLGLWHQLKASMWREHIEYCKYNEERNAK
jgi:hypothetical protein